MKESNMANKNIGELVKLAQKGNTRAFEEIINQKTETILFNSLSILGKYHDAEDATQEVVLKMYRKINTLKDPSAFNAWMHKVISSVCYSIGRTKKKMKENFNIDDYNDALVEEDKEFLPIEYAEKTEERGMLQEIISEMPGDRRRVLIMHYYDEMSYEQIANALNLSVGSVAGHLSYAKKKIKVQMEAKTGETPKVIKSSAGIPVLTQVLRSQSKDLLPESYVKNVAQMCSSKVNTLVGSGSSAFSGSTAFKIIGAVLALTVVVSCGIVAIANFTKDSGPKDSRNNGQIASSNIKDKASEGEIVLQSHVCDCGHVNPKKAIVSGLDFPSDSYSWTISDPPDGKLIYTGKGDTITDELTKLYRQKQDGKYVIVFSVLDEDGYMHNVEREILVNTGEIPPHHYE